MNEIEYIKVQIIKKRQEIDYYNNINKNSSSTYLSEKDKHLISLLEKELHHLQQIKTKLEAWEELKPEIKEHKDVLYEDELTNSLVFALPYSANPKKYNAIKKAMEVSDES